MCEGDWEKFNNEEGAFPKWWSIENIYPTADGFTVIALMCGCCDEIMKGVLATPAIVKLLTENKEVEKNEM